MWLGEPISVWGEGVVGIAITPCTLKENIRLAFASNFGQSMSLIFASKNSIQYYNLQLCSGAAW